MRRFFFYAQVAILIFFFCAFVPRVYASEFLRDLRLGERGEDVRALQVFLNSDPDTVITRSGPGSPGQETTYFGVLTKNSVIRLQNKWREEILVPFGLFSGTGFVGKATRSYLNTRANFQNTASQSQIPPKTTATATSSPSAAVSSGSDDPRLAPMTYLRLYKAVPYNVLPGGKLTISGENISKDTFIHFGTGYKAAVTAGTKTGEYEAYVPTEIPEGTYEIWLENVRGMSKASGVTNKLVVTRNPKSVPVVTAVSPSAPVSLDTDITVIGSGFSGDVSVYSAFGSITSLRSSSGTSLVFKASQFPNQSVIQSILKNKPAEAALSISFFVVADGGISEQPAVFVVQ